VPRQPELQLVQQRTVNRTPKSVVADLVEALRQHVLQKSADKFQGRQSHGLPTVMAGVLVAETDLSILDREQTAIGQCNPMNIPASVAEDLFGPVHSWFTVYHPLCRTDRLRDSNIGTFLVCQISEAASEELGERPDRHKVMLAGRAPRGPISGDPAGRDQAMDVWMVDERPGPSV
jgi:hypothetical protein